jgi:hypothetical protein
VHLQIGESVLGMRRASWPRRRALGSGNLGLFVLIIVGIVVAQTWYDWRKNNKDLVLPEWAKGVALGGVLAVCLAAITSYATGWMQDSATQSAASDASRVFWPQVALVAISGGVIFLMTRKKRLNWLLLLTGMILAAFCVGMFLSS